jgi:predicted Zn-ribbon and HTH transcriptional regulator
MFENNRRNKERNKMIPLKCKKCGKKWKYKGKKKFYTTCPDCKTSVKITQ